MNGMPPGLSGSGGFSVILRDAAKDRGTPADIIRNVFEKEGQTMDLMTVGTVSGYVRAMDSRRQAEQKQHAGTDEKPSDIKEWIKQQEESAGSSDRQDISWRNTGDQKLSGIQNKFYSGGNLTKTEREYLRAKNPALYQRFLASEAEKQSYKRALKRCRTREEVHRLKMSHTAGAMGTLKSDGAAASDKMNGIQSSTGEFVRSGEYHALPTEHEKAVAEKRVKQAEERQQRKRTEKSGEKRDSSDSKKLFRDIRPGETVEQAKNSPEMLKVRRARAKRAYGNSSQVMKVVISEKV